MGQDRSVASHQQAGKKAGFCPRSFGGSSWPQRITGFVYWSDDGEFLMYPAQAIVAQWLASFKDFPPRAKAASFTIDKVMEELMPKS
ncbi:MAG: hypothetical protein JOZ49_22230 [Mycolicibacterium sp.]|nr:hypothetical protein [Mycolicibacterium sp.]